MEYLDVDLEIGPGSGREYPLVVRSAAGGEARLTMRFPFDDLALHSRLKDLQIALLRSANLHRKVLSEEEQAVQDFGRSLFETLLGSSALAIYDVSRNRAAQEGRPGVRLRLRILDPALAALPWEYLYDPRQGEYLCLSRSTPLVRYPEIAQPIQPLKVAPPLRILGMIASPSDMDELDVTREQERMRAALQTLEEAGHVELTWLKGQTWEDLQEAMWGGPWHIFHFIGHGGFDARREEGVIALADERGKAHLLNATQLALLLTNHSSLRMVILNACEGAKGDSHDLFSSTAATLARRGIPAVLAMQEEITDRAAIQLTRTFYRALAHGLSVDAAVSEARAAIRLSAAQTLEWGTPVLYMRAPDGRLFDVQGQPTTQPASSKTKEQWVDEGEQHRAARRFKEALAAFEEAIKLDPGYVLAYRGKSIALNALGRADEALAACDQAIKLNPNDGRAYYNKGIFLSGLKRYPEALDAYNQAIRLEPGFAWAYSGKGNVLWQLGRYEDAAAAYDRATQLNDKDTAAWIGKGNALRKLKRYQEALAAYERAAQLAPTSLSAYIGKAKALRKLKRYQEALEAAEQAIKLDPNDAVAYREKGDALNRLRRHKEALAAHERSIQLAPAYADAYVGKADALDELERPAEALAACDQALQIDSRHVRAHTERGHALVRLNRLQEALAAYEQAIRLDSDFADGYVGRAIALAALNRHEESLATCERALQLDPASPLAWGWKGQALTHLKRLPEALAAFNQAIRLDSAYALFHYDKGNVLAQLQRYAEALQAYEQAIFYNPVFVDAWLAKGNTLMRLGRATEARQALQKAKELGTGA